MTTALVVGATGAVGSALVDQLATADHVDRVVALTRRPVEHASDRVENQVVDFARLDDFADDFRGDLLFSALGTTRALAGSTEAQRVVDHDYQLAAARLGAAGGVRHYLLVSSGQANSRSRNPYLRMKGELEESVNAMAFERVSIFRPGLILGDRPDSRPAEAVGAVVARGLSKLPFLRSLQPVTGADVAARMVAESRLAGPGRAVIERAEFVHS